MSNATAELLVLVILTHAALTAPKGWQSISAVVFIFILMREWKI